VFIPRSSLKSYNNPTNILTNNKCNPMNTNGDTQSCNTNLHFYDFCTWITIGIQIEVHPIHWWSRAPPHVGDENGSLLTKEVGTKKIGKIDLEHTTFLCPWTSLQICLFSNGLKSPKLVQCYSPMLHLCRQLLIMPPYGRDVNFQIINGN